MKSMNKIAGSLDLVLDKVLVNRIQKKAKNVSSEAVNLILAIFVLCGNKLVSCGYGMNNENGDQNGINDDALNGDGLNGFAQYYFALQECYVQNNDRYEFYMLLYILGYCVVAGSFAVLHAILLVRGLETTQEIEDAYKKTNKFPIIDVLLEIPLTWKNSKYFTILVWFHFIIIANLGVMEFLSIGVSGHTVVTAMIIFSGYRMTGELCEYRIHTLKTKDGNDDEAYVDDENAYALEMSTQGADSLLPSKAVSPLV